MVRGEREREKRMNQPELEEAAVGGEVSEWR